MKTNLGRIRNSSSGNAAGGGQPPGESRLEKRIEVLEKAFLDMRERFLLFESRLSNIESNMVTRLDIAALASNESLQNVQLAVGKDIQNLAVAIHKQGTEIQKILAEQVWRYIGFAAAIATLAFTAARLMHQ